MMSKTAVKFLFIVILISMIVCTGWASSHQSVLNWSGLTTGLDRYWTIATMFDAYFGFLTFYVWVFYKEARWLPRLAWFVAIMLLGNMAMACYVLWQLFRLPAHEPASAILTARSASLR